PVDGLAHDGDGALVDLRGIPALDRAVVRFARLIACTAPPAVADEEVRGRMQRVRLVAQVEMGAARTADAILQDVCRHELGLADFTMHRAYRLRAEVALIDELESGIELAGEVFGTAAVIGQRCDSRQRVLLAEIGAEAGFHAPDGDQRAGRNAITLLDRREESGVLLLLGAAALDDGVRAALLHEVFKGELEALLIAVGIDGGLRIFG